MARGAWDRSVLSGSLAERLKAGARGVNKLAILLLAGAVAMPGQAGAMPTTFGPVVGNALLCVDDIDPAYFRRYLTDFLQPPYKTEGAAYWFKADTTLLGVKISDVFVSTEKTRYAFIGAVMKDSLAAARDKIQQFTGVRFQPEGDDATLRSPAGTYLISYGKDRSKIFCVKRRVDRFY